MEFKIEILPYTEMVLNALENPKSILVVGCGQSGQEILMKQKYPKARVVACDILPEAIAIARGLAKANKADIEYEYVDMAGAVPYTDKEFDSVVCEAVMMMVPEMQALNIANNIKRIARKKIILVELHAPKAWDVEFAFGGVNGRYARDYAKFFIENKNKHTEIPDWPGETYQKNGRMIEIWLNS